MTRDDIARIAREAGDDWDHTLPKDRKFLIRFAALVAAHEREECAKEADYEAARWAYAPEASKLCKDIAASIRLRSKK